MPSPLRSDPSFQLRTPADQTDRKLLSDVEEFGWHVCLIPEDDEGPGFAFTVGLLYSYGHPELLAIGLSPAASHGLLSGAVERIKAGQELSEGPVSDLAYGLDLYFAPIDEAHLRAYLGYALWFYKSLGAPLPALQLVWPDAAGRFPWQSRHDPKLAALQPVLCGRLAAHAD